MNTRHNRWMGGAAAALAAALTLASPAAHAAAQQRMLIPEGTVLTVRTESTINSNSARVGQTFRTRTTEPLRVEGYTALPQGTVVEGVVTQVRPATRAESGIVAVEFNRMMLPGGQSVPMLAKLTSTDANERRQIESQADPRVVLVGGRSGVGAVVAGVGNNDSGDPLSNVLGALGSIFSNGSDVNVPPGTMLAVQLERGLDLSVNGSPTYGNDEYTLYTSSQMIRAAQQALRDRSYYRGAMSGTLDDATQRALFEFQNDNRIMATGNLDARTAMALGLDLSAYNGRSGGQNDYLGGRGYGRGGAYGYLSTSDASNLRRGAQSLVADWRSYLGIQNNGRLDQRRDYRSSDLAVYFALSGFADNAGLYEQMVRSGGSQDGMAAATQALATAARRVDDALRDASAPARITQSWQNVRDDLTRFEGGSGRNYR